MKRILLTAAAALSACLSLSAQVYDIKSPDGHISVTIKNQYALTYSVQLDGKTLIADSPMGFEFKGEPDMKGNFTVRNDAAVNSGVEKWTPVINSKHAQCEVPYNEITLDLQEKEDGLRKMKLSFRVMNDGVAFRYGLYGLPTMGSREITRELTGYSVPEKSFLWIPDFAYEDGGRSYKSSQEGVFKKTPVKNIQGDIHAGLPGLIQVDIYHWLAIMEADLDNFPAFYLGRSAEAYNGYQMLDTKLTPIWGNDESGAKARFDDTINTSWRVIMVGHDPGRFIESEILRSLNPDCVIKDPYWIKPGKSAWDHWWSGDIKMEQDEIKRYIDFASKEGWQYMLIDWTWYGQYNVPEADITKPAPQLDLQELIRYANLNGVDIWLWLRCEDVNNNSQYMEAFPLYRQWGVRGVKIDFMDRDDQDMVNWYRRIIKAAADNHLMVDFHGAYKPDGIERTYPNVMTREGVMGAEYYKFSDKMTPEHNVALAYTRLLAGQMDYTPGGFLNVTAEEFRQQSPTLVSNTRAAELAKFVVYESPFTVVCDDPEHIYGQVGEDFIRVVPTVWDDIHFLGGTPDTYVSIAKQHRGFWFIGALNNSRERSIALDVSFLPEGTYKIECWKDGSKSSKNPTDCEYEYSTVKIGKDKRLHIKMAKGGGYTAIIWQ